MHPMLVALPAFSAFWQKHCSGWELRFAGVLSQRTNSGIVPVRLMSGMRSLGHPAAYACLPLPGA
jgi:hypothetical protein